jgi:prepilin-type N-terminal cleavage/methylation domain-containing protein
MDRSRKPVRSSGFTLIEVIVVLALMVILLLFSFPSLLKTIHRSKLLGITSQASVLMQQARFEAIKRNVSVFVVADLTYRSISVVTDDNGNGVWDIATDGARARADLPARISFWYATDAAANGAKAVTFSPLTCSPACSNRFAAVYRPDGSVTESGAFRFGDELGNFTEVKVMSTATGRPEAHKYDPTSSAGTVDEKYVVNGDNTKAWTWQ